MNIGLGAETAVAGSAVRRCGDRHFLLKDAYARVVDQRPFAEGARGCKLLADTVVTHLSLDEALVSLVLPRFRDNGELLHFDNDALFTIGAGLCPTVRLVRE